MREDELNRVPNAQQFFLLFQDEVEKRLVRAHGTLVVGVLAPSGLREVVALHGSDFFLCRLAIQFLPTDLPIFFGEDAAYHAVRSDVVVHAINEDEGQALDPLRRKPVTLREMAVDQPIELLPENALQVGGFLFFDHDNPNTPNLSLIHISEPTRPY